MNLFFALLLSLSLSLSLSLGELPDGLRVSLFLARSLCQIFHSVFQSSATVIEFANYNTHILVIIIILSNHLSQS